MASLSRWLCAVIFSALWGLGSAIDAFAAPIELSYELRPLASPSRYEYTYTLSNVSFAGALKWFSVDFDPARYDESSLVVTSSGLGDWTQQILGSVPGIPAQYDAYKGIGPGIAMGEFASGFKVEFTWLGAGAPGSQAFTLWDPTTLDVLFTGISTAGGTTPIPEPATAALLLAGVALVAVATRRRRRSLQR